MRYIFVLSVLGISMVACNRVDDTDLSAVAAYYHRLDTTQEQRFRYVSKRGAAFVDRGLWRSEATGRDVIEANATVLRTIDHDRSTYGLVQVRRRHQTLDGQCSTVRTETWVRDDDKWRRLALPLLEQKARHLFQNGDYKAAIDAAEEALTLDPYSIEAYGRLLQSLERATGLSAERRTRDDVLRALLAINDRDTDVLYDAASSSPDVSVRKIFFSQLPEDACDRGDIAFNVVRDIVGDPQGVLDFLQVLPAGDPGGVLLRARALAQMNRLEDLRTLLLEAPQERLRRYFDENDPRFTAVWSAIAAKSALKAGLTDFAETLVAIGLARDPTNEELSQLTRRLEDPSLRELAVHLRPAPDRTRYSKAAFVARSEFQHPIDMLQLRIYRLNGDGSVQWRRIAVGCASRRDCWKQIQPGAEFPVVVESVFSPSDWEAFPELLLFEVIEVKLNHPSGYRRLTNDDVALYISRSPRQ